MICSTALIFQKTDFSFLCVWDEWESSQPRFFELKGWINYFPARSGTDTEMEELTCSRHPKASELSDGIGAPGGPCVLFCTIAGLTWASSVNWYCTASPSCVGCDHYRRNVTSGQIPFWVLSTREPGFPLILSCTIPHAKGGWACVTNHFPYMRERRIRLKGKLWGNGYSVAHSAPSKACCLRNVSKAVVSFCLLCQILAIKSIIKQLLSLPKDILHWSPENGAYNWITTDQLSQQPPPHPNTNERKKMRQHNSDFYSDDVPLLCSSTEPSRTEEKSSSSLHFLKAY